MDFMLFASVIKSIFGVPMGPTYPIYELNLITIHITYLCTKFGINRIEIAVE